MKYLNFLSPDQTWLCQQDAEKKMNLKRTTLYKLRMLHKLKWSQLGRKVFYLNKSLDELLDSNASDFCINKVNYKK